jgi:hypothetical protein
MNRTDQHITIVVQNGSLCAIGPTKSIVVDGVYDVVATNALENRWQPSRLSLPPDGLISAVRFSASLAHLDSFSESVGFVCSLRATGHIVIYELGGFSVLTVSGGVVVGFAQERGNHQTVLTSGDEDGLRQFVLRMLKPVDGLFCWCSPGALEIEAHLSLPLEHLLLDSIRQTDEVAKRHNRTLERLPNSARLVPNLNASLDQRQLIELRAVLGMPPYLIGKLKQMTISESALTDLYDAIDAEVLIIERHHEVTAPPHLSAGFDVDRLELQDLVARFNHVFRRLIHISGWNTEALAQQLVVFGQFYGYQSVFEGVSQHADGALDPLPLIENAIATHKRNHDRILNLAEALQELVFFELSSARTIDAKERRTLMSMTTQLVASCINSKRGDVA